MSVGRIYVNSEQSIIQVMIDFKNFLQPEKRISGMEYKFFEALVYAQRELGSINTASADTYVMDYLEKPDMIRKSFRGYRNSLVEKGWLHIDIQGNKETYSLPADFNLHGKTFKAKGELTQLTTVIERINDLERENISGAG